MTSAQTRISMSWKHICQRMGNTDARGVSEWYTFPSSRTWATLIMMETTMKKAKTKNIMCPKFVCTKTVCSSVTSSQTTIWNRVRAFSHLVIALAARKSPSTFLCSKTRNSNLKDRTRRGQLQAWAPSSHQNEAMKVLNRTKLRRSTLNRCSCWAQALSVRSTWCVRRVRESFTQWKCSQKKKYFQTT